MVTLEGHLDLLAAFADAHPPDRIAIQVELDQGLGTPLAEIGVRASLDDAEERLVGPRVGCLAAHGPGDRPIDGAG